MAEILNSLTTSAGMLWKAFWALVFGYAISAVIQVLVTKRQMGKALGERGLRQAGLAGFFGFISSSCSFAALAASRAVFVKGAHPANALAFVVASTNLRSSSASSCGCSSAGSSLWPTSCSEPS